MFTMHATTMVFLFVMPMAAAFANYFIPLQIGARDVAFPRLNALELLDLRLRRHLHQHVVVPRRRRRRRLVHVRPEQLARRSRRPTASTSGRLGLQITGIASLVGAINLIVTVLNMRAPGMTLMKMPIFTWMALVTQFLLLFAIPVITVALFLLMFQRNYDATFFSVADGADPLLWQHLFWIFGHPEVYIIVLPVLRHRVRSAARVLEEAAVRVPVRGVLRRGHRLRRLGRVGPPHVRLRPRPDLGRRVLGVHDGDRNPDRRQDRQLDPHDVGRQVWFTTAMLFAIGLIVEFTIGGLSGVTHSVAPSDTQQTDTYYIVAHFHYVIFGGGVLGLFAGLYYWWPKMFGKMLSEKLGKWNFWLMIIGMNLTFGPMHIIGLQGQPRRMYCWTDARAGEGFFNLGFWNLVASVGTIILGIGILFFFINVWVDPQGAARPGRPVGRPHRSSGSPPARRRRTTSIAPRRCTRSTSSSTASTKTSATGDHHDYEQVMTGEEVIAEEDRARRRAHPPAVAVLLAADPVASACRSWRTASSTTRC